MVSVIDKILSQEKEMDGQLMQLALADVGSGGNNAVTGHILESPVSFKMVIQIIKMASLSYLKPL